MFDPPTGGSRIYRSVNTARGTYGWTNVTTRVSPLRDASVKDGIATLILGLEACTGRAEFDLSALRIEFEDVGLTPVNQDYIVRYPPEANLEMTTAAVSGMAMSARMAATSCRLKLLVFCLFCFVSMKLISLEQSL